MDSSKCKASNVNTSITYLEAYESSFFLYTSFRSLTIHLTLYNGGTMQRRRSAYFYDVILIILRWFKIILTGYKFAHFTTNTGFGICPIITKHTKDKCSGRSLLEARDTVMGGRKQGIRQLTGIYRSSEMNKSSIYRGYPKVITLNTKVPSHPFYLNRQNIQRKYQGNFRYELLR